MIHNAWGGTQGDARDMRKQADVLDKITNEIAEVYVKKTNIPYDKVIEMMNEETWLTAKEAVALGFVNSISEPIKVAAKYDVSRFKNITNKKVDTILSLTEKKKIKMTEELKTWFNSKVDEIIAKVKTDGSETRETVESVEVEVKLTDNEDVMNKFSDLEGTILTLNNSIIELEGEKETLSVEINRVNALLSKSEAKGTDTSTDSDPAVVENKVEDANSNFFDNLASKIK